MRVKGTDHDALKRLVAASSEVVEYSKLYPATPKRVVEIVSQVADSYAEMGIDLIFELDEGDSARADRLRTSFGLTLAEAAIALHIGAGGNMRQFAEQRRLSRNTARNQLQQVFEKTGMRRQAELVRLLSDF